MRRHRRRENRARPRWSASRVRHCRSRRPPLLCNPYRDSAAVGGEWKLTYDAGQRFTSTHTDDLPPVLAGVSRCACRPAHSRAAYLGTLFGVAALVAAAATRDWHWLLAAPVIGYAFAWVGHLVFERTGRRPSGIRAGR